MEKLFVVSIFVITFVVSSFVGRWFNLDIVPRMDPWGLYYHYPFTCEKCFTTWLMCGMYIVGAYFMDMPLYGVLGCIVSVANGIGMWLTEMERRK